VALVDVVVPLAVAFGVYRLAVKAASGQRFLFPPERSISVSGNRVVSRNELLEALGFNGFGGDAGLNLFRLNLTAERQRVEEIPWVKSATITRIFPDSLAVRVLERKPVAFANVAGQIELVDGDGAFLRMPSRASFDFPVIEGLASVANLADRKQRLDRYLQFTSETQDEAARYGWKVSQADLSRLDDLRILLVRGNQTILVHFGDKEFRRRFTNFLSIVARVLQTHPKINSMDLRYHNEVVIDPDLGGGR
jgi:cell division protein FtsQ